jgi:hypothetical protein
MYLSKVDELLNIYLVKDVVKIISSFLCDYRVTSLEFIPKKSLCSNSKLKYIDSYRDDSCFAWHTLLEDGKKEKDNSIDTSGIMARIIATCGTRGTHQAPSIKVIGTPTFRAEFALDEQNKLFLRQFTQLNSDSGRDAMKNGWDIKWSSKFFTVEEESYYINGKLYFQRIHNVFDPRFVTINFLVVYDLETGNILYKYGRLQLMCYFKDDKINTKIEKIPYSDYADHYWRDKNGCIRKIIYIDNTTRCIGDLPELWQHLATKFPRDWRQQQQNHSSLPSSSENMFDDFIAVMSGHFFQLK